MYFSCVLQAKLQSHMQNHFATVDKRHFPPKIKQPEYGLTTHLYLMLRLRMKVVLLLCPHYAFVVPY